VAKKQQEALVKEKLDKAKIAKLKEKGILDKKGNPIEQKGGKKKQYKQQAESEESDEDEEPQQKVEKVLLSKTERA
jgi:hypothetical protein